MFTLTVSGREEDKLGCSWTSGGKCDEALRLPGKYQTDDFSPIDVILTLLTEKASDQDKNGEKYV